MSGVLLRSLFMTCKESASSKAHLVRHICVIIEHMHHVEALGAVLRNAAVGLNEAMLCY